MVIDFNKGNGGGGSGYTLPIASSSVLGGVKVGSGLTINPQSGVLSAEGGQGGGIEVVSQLPASGTDGQMVMLVETLPSIKIEGREGDFNPVSCTATGITQKTFLFSWEYYGDTWKVYVNTDHSVEIYNDQNSQTTTYSAGTSGAVYNFTEDRYITTNVTSNGFVMTPNENVGRYLFVDDSEGGERQILFVYGTSPKPAIEYIKSRDGHFLDINWIDVQRVLADGDTMFDVMYFGNISYSAGTIYSKTDSGLNITPSSTVEERNDVYIQLDGDTLKFCMDRIKTISAFTLGNKSEMSGWTRVGITQEDYADGVANNDNYGKVKVKNRVDGLYIGTDGYLKSDVSVATATTGTTGVVKPSSGLNIDSQGTLTTQVQTENVGNHIVKIWLGTQAEFDQIATPDQYTVYIIKQTTTQSN